jgi:hypothetical protein
MHDFNPGYYPYNKVTTDYYIKNPAHIKSSEVVTYDNQGNVVPLSKRHNFDINNLMYTVAPFLIGAGAVASDDKE